MTNATTIKTLQSVAGAMLILSLSIGMVYGDDQNRAIKKLIKNSVKIGHTDNSNLVSPISQRHMEEEDYFQDLLKFADLIADKSYEDSLALAKAQIKISKKSRNQEFVWLALTGLSQSKNKSKGEAKSSFARALCLTGHIPAIWNIKCDEKYTSSPIAFSLFEFDMFVSVLNAISLEQWVESDVYGAVLTEKTIVQAIEGHLNNPKENIRFSHKDRYLYSDKIEQLVKELKNGLGLNIFIAFASQAQFTLLNAVEKERGSALTLYDFTESEFLASFIRHKTKIREIKKKLDQSGANRVNLQSVLDGIEENVFAKMKINVTVRNMLLRGAATIEQYDYLLTILKDDKNKDNQIRLYHQYGNQLLSTGRTSDAIKAYEKGLALIGKYNLVDEEYAVLHWTRLISSYARALSISQGPQEKIDKAIERALFNHEIFSSIYRDILKYEPQAKTKNIEILMSVPMRQGLMNSSLIQQLSFHNNHRLFELGMSELYIDLGRYADAKKWLDQDAKTTTDKGHKYSVNVQAFEAYVSARYHESTGSKQKASLQYAEAVTLWYSSPNTLIDSIQGIFSYRYQLLDRAIEFEFNSGDHLKSLDYIELSRNATIDSLSFFDAITEEHLIARQDLFFSELDSMLEDAKNSASAKGESEKFQSKLDKVNFNYRKISPENNFRALLQDKRGAFNNILNAVMPWVDYSKAQSVVDQYFYIESSVNTMKLKPLRSEALRREYALAKAASAGLNNKDSSLQNPLFGVLDDTPLKQFENVGINQRFSLHQVQQLLGNDQSVLSYWLTKDKLYMHVVNANEVRHNVININDLQKFFPDQNRVFRRSQLAKIYNIILEPFTPALKSRVVIVANGSLQYVPFAGFSDAQGFFGDKHLLRYSPTISQIFAQDIDLKKDRMLVMAPSNVPSTPDLPGAKAEATSLKNNFGAKLALDDKVTRSFFMENVPEYSIVHFAGHGQLNPEFPDYSKLVLFDANAEYSEVFVEDIKQLNLLGLQLVVLSACESGATKPSDLNNEFSSLSSSFMSAGAQSVVSSTKEVEDTATTFLMQRFYEALAEGNDKDLALQTAQKALREKLAKADRLDAYPYEWTNFKLWGSRSPIALSK